MSAKPTVESLGQERIPVLVGRYFTSTFAALLFSALYNIVDSVFVSRGIGAAAMGAVAVVGPFMMIQAAVAQTVGAGAASLISRFLGKKQSEAAGEVSLNAMALFYATALCVTAAGLVFTEPILSALGATGELHDYARDYFIIVVSGTVFSTGFSSLIRAEGRMNYALLIWLIPTFVNIVLDALFIFALDMGVKGAALATVLCQATSCSMWFLFLTRFSAQRLRGARLNRRIMGEIIAVGFPTFLQIGGSGFMSMVLNRLLSAVGGAHSVTCYAYMTRLSGMGTVPFNALTQAIAPVIGYNHGAGRQDRVRATLRFSLGAGIVYSLALLLLTQLLSENLIALLTADASFIRSGAAGLRILVLAAPMLPVWRVSSAYFQAVGSKRLALVLNLIVFALLPGLAAVFSRFWADAGIYWAYLPSYIIVAAVCATALRWERKKYR